MGFGFQASFWKEGIENTKGLDGFLGIYGEYCRDPFLYFLLTNSEFLQGPKRGGNPKQKALQGIGMCKAWGFLQIRDGSRVQGWYNYILGIMEKKMETTIMGYIGGYIGIMEKKMETATV